MRKYVTMLVLLMLIGATLFPSPATPRFTIRSFSVHGAQNRDCSGCANYDRCLSENRGHDNCKQYIPAGCSCAVPADKPPETSEERAKREERERRIDRCERDCVAEKQRRQKECENRTGTTPASCVNETGPDYDACLRKCRR